MKKTLLLIMLSSILSLQNSEAQSSNDIKSVGNIELVRKAKSIFYYGGDFSHLRITDGPKISRSYEYSQVYPMAWITYLEKELEINGYLLRALKKESVVYKQEEIYDISIRVSPDFIIGKTYSFPIDTINNALKKYPLSQKSGVGLVLIPENFIKTQEIAKTWIVFFNIENREILWATKVRGNCEHMGYTAHWGSGIIDGFKEFISTQYKIDN
ncbi:MAG: hypothetical protein NTW10_00400 [Bacteroidetes bacterium]|nr:hypothetical protein [Bacteroidota bacterium]